MSLESFFIKIKPSCDKLCAFSTKENIEQFRQSLQDIACSNLDIRYVSLLQNYVLFPLVSKMVDINDKETSEVKTQLLLCTKDVLSMVRTKDLNAFKTILMAVLEQVFDFKKGYLQSDISEERKLAAMDCIFLLFQRALRHVIENFYNKENLTILRSVIGVCVEIISTEKYRTLRISAIKCLMMIFYVYNESELCDIVMRHDVANLLFKYIPSIIRALIVIATGDETLGEKLKSVAIRALGRILCLIFTDYDRSIVEPSYSSTDFLELLKSKNEETITDDQVLSQQERTGAWLTVVSRKLLQPLRLLTQIRASESKRLREEYAIMCLELLKNCFKYLKESYGTFLETIIALTQDNDDEVRKLCSGCIEELLQNMNGIYIFEESVSNLFEVHLNRLPAVIKRCEDAEQTSEFLFFKGFFKVVPEGTLRTLFCFHENINKFCMCIISALDLELNRSLIVEEYALRVLQDDDSNITGYPWRNFKNLSTERTAKLFQEVCFAVGGTSAANLIFDELVSILPRNMHIYNEIVIGLMFLLTACETICDNEKVHQIYFVLDEILHENHWHLTLQPDPITKMAKDENTRWYTDSTPGLYESAIEITVKDIQLDEDDDDDDFVVIGDVQFNVLHICIILDAIGNFSLKLGEHYQPYVFKSLHKILLKASSSNCMVHLSANFALNCIRKALNLETNGNLINHFSDYLSYHINSSLKKVDRSKDAADILSVVLQYSSKSSLEILENIIATILDESANCRDNNNLTSYLKVFQIFLSKLNQWDNETHSVEGNEENSKLIESAEEMYSNWLNVLNKCEDESDFPETSSIHEAAEQQTEFFPEGSAQNDLPRYIQITIAIMRKVAKFVSSNHKMLKIMAMDCLIYGIPLLRDYEDELLPIVHSIWDPLSQRFKDNDSVVLYRSFSLLNVLATYSKDFILCKTLKDVFPFLCEFLKSSAANIEKNRKTISTQETKLQFKLLQQLPRFLININVQEQQLDEVMEIVIQYLDKRQPITLQASAVEFFNTLCSYNCPHVYVKLVYYKDHNIYTDCIKSVFSFINK